jgi:ATP-dependent Clp protease ATP-binding subunit ClpA
MDDFDVAPDKIGESAQRVMNRAVEESRRREHAIVANEHLFVALTQVEWDTFSHVMQDLEVNPHVILDALDEHLQLLPTLSGCELRVAPNTKTVFQLVFNLSRPSRSAAARRKRGSAHCASAHAMCGSTRRRRFSGARSQPFNGLAQQSALASVLPYYLRRPRSKSASVSEL